MSNLFGEFEDLNAGKHGGNAQSNAANVKVAPFKINYREQVLGLMAIRDAAGKGTTLRDACGAMGKEKNELSSCFTKLKADGKIEPTGFVEEGFMVYRVTGSSRVKIKSAE